MKILMEPLIIFMVVYLPGVYYSLTNLSWNGIQFYSFNLNQELSRVIIHDIPGLCLIWYFLLKEPLRSELTGLKPHKKDFFQAAKVVLGLLVIGSGVSIIINSIFHFDNQGIIIPGVFSWVVIGVSCIVTGYMEESYFRVYLFKHLTLSGISRNAAVIASCVLFCICHVYQGPVGLVTAGFAGLFLSYMYIKSGSIHGIALGHGMYNLISYIIAQRFGLS